MTTFNRTPESVAPSSTRTEVIGDRSVAVPNRLRPVRAVVGTIGCILLLAACASGESVKMTLFDGDDGETQAWVAERAIRCVQLLKS